MTSKNIQCPSKATSKVLWNLKILWNMRSTNWCVYPPIKIIWEMRAQRGCFNAEILNKKNDHLILLKISLQDKGLKKKSTILLRIICQLSCGSPYPFSRGGDLEPVRVHSTWMWGCRISTNHQRPRETHLWDRRPRVTRVTHDSGGSWALGSQYSPVFGAGRITTLIGQTQCRPTGRVVKLSTTS